MGIAERVLVFVILCYAHAVLAELNEQLENDDLSNFDYVNLNSGRADDQDLDESITNNKESLRNGDAADGLEDEGLGSGVPNIQSAGMVAPALPSCNGWQAVGQASPCPSGLGSCITVCLNCQPSQPNYIPGTGPVYQPAPPYYSQNWQSQQQHQEQNVNVPGIIYQPGQIPAYDYQPINPLPKPVGPVVSPQIPQHQPQDQPNSGNIVIQTPMILPGHYPNTPYAIAQNTQHQQQAQTQENAGVVIQPQGYPSVLVPSFNQYVPAQNTQHQQQAQTQDNSGIVLHPQGYPSVLVPSHNPYAPAQNAQIQTQEQIISGQSQSQAQNQNQINSGYGHIQQQSQSQTQENSGLVPQPGYPSVLAPSLNPYIPAQNGQYQNQEQINSGQSQVQNQNQINYGQNGQMQSQAQDQSNGYLVNQPLMANNAYGYPPNGYLAPSRNDHQQSQSQSQSQSNGGQMQSQSQLQVGRNGLPLSDEKHSVRNNIRLRIYA